jgi:hypothetical protein
LYIELNWTAETGNYVREREWEREREGEGEGDREELIRPGLHNRWVAAS